MTLEKAIKEQKRIAENFYEASAVYYSSLEWHMKQEKSWYKEMAECHEQIAKWLEELQELKNGNEEDCVSRQEVLDQIYLWSKDEFLRVTNPFHYLRKRINSLQPIASTQEWIPVSERLPKEENKSYWICTDYGHQCECRWTNVNPIWTDLTTDWHWHHMDVPQYNKVVAWKPLPKPYKEENEG